MKPVVQIAQQGKKTDVRASTAAAGLPTEEIETKVAQIQTLIPLGLQAIGEAPDAEVTALSSIRYCRRGGQSGVVRWGQERGSFYLADQKRPLPVPRVRYRAANREIALTTYEQLQRPQAADAGLFRRILVGLTCRQDNAYAEAVPEAFGLSVSRRFIRASARPLQTLCERRLDGGEFVAMAITLVITLQGQKKTLGFVQTATENESVCAAFLRALVERGLRVAPDLRCVIDGATHRHSDGIWSPCLGPTWSATSPKRSRPPGGDGCNTPMSDRRRPTPSRRWGGSDRNCARATSLPPTAWTRDSRRRSRSIGWAYSPC